MRNNNAFSINISYKDGGRLIVEELRSVAASMATCIRFTRKALPSLAKPWRA